MKLLLLGPVGSGKGTQAALISKRYNIPHISTGDIFRWNMKNQTELGKQAAVYYNAGELVPESLTIKIVEDRLAKDDCKKGFILDGFPRNMAQASALEKMTGLDKVIFVYLDEKEIIKRLSSRRMCKDCGQPTALAWMKNGKCEKCGGDVCIRDDDKPEVIKRRLITNAIPSELIDLYKKKGIFYKINATDDVEETYKLIDSILKK